MSRLLLIICLVSAAGFVRAQDEGAIFYLHPDWSPDGSKIAFEGGFDGKLSIAVIDIDGTNLTQLTGNNYNDERPVWSPDGSKIAFFSNRSKKRDEQPVSLQIYIMNADGTGQRRVTHEGPALEYNISWSPDGTRLVFQSRPEINPDVHSLYIIGVNGTARSRVTNGEYNDTSPQWSPDGNLILFVQSKASYKFYQERTSEERKLLRKSPEIRILNLIDRTITPITENDLPDYDPSWNVDGSEIYYLQNDGQKKTFFRQKLNQPNPVSVADGNIVSNSGFVTKTRLSPNGRFLTYNKEINGLHGIYIYDLENNDEKLLVGGAKD